MTNESDDWVVEAGLMEATGLTKRQIREYRDRRWVKGVHYKNFSPNPLSTGNCSTMWYERTLIKRLVGQAK